MMVGRTFLANYFLVLPIGFRELPYAFLPTATVKSRAFLRLEASQCRAAMFAAVQGNTEYEYERDDVDRFRASELNNAPFAMTECAYLTLPTVFHQRETIAMLVQGHRSLPYVQLLVLATT